MKKFLSFLSNIYVNGKDILNKRTNQICRTIVGEQLEFDISRSFPILTTRKMFFSGQKGELLSFLRGYSNAADFRKLGCNLWNQNANETKGWLDNPHRKGVDDCGRIYGVQWTKWQDTKIIERSDWDKFKNSGYSIAGLLSHNPQKMVITRTINQLENALRTILTNPSDRRIIVTGWNPAELEMMSLPPCHVSYTFIPEEEDKVLNVVMNIRSMDSFLGAPTNIVTTSLFLAIMARLSGYTAGKVVIQGANVHLYKNSLDAVMEQSQRTPLPLPRLILSGNIKKVSLDEIPGAFERIQPEDIWLEEYTHHDPIKVDMIA